MDGTDYTEKCSIVKSKLQLIVTVNNVNFLNMKEIPAMWVVAMGDDNTLWCLFDDILLYKCHHII